MVSTGPLAPEDLAARRPAGDDTAHGACSQEPSSAVGSRDFALRALAPLAEKIAKQQAVLYVGAGASVSSGFDGWDKLLAVLQKNAENELQNEDEVARAYFRGLIAKSKNLEAGDWLHKLLNNTLGSLVRTIFGDGSKVPSVIHHTLARMPFTMAVTTNYDKLLDSAFESAGKTFTPWTWLETPNVLPALKNGDFGVLHAHGIFDKPDSIILTGRQYGVLGHSAPRFGELLKWLLMTRTFLFVGASLDDPDLIYQLQQGYAEYGPAFGPHYALVPYNEAPRLRQDILLASLQIKLIPVGDAAKAAAGDKHWLTKETSSLLRDLSGKVSLAQYTLQRFTLPTSDDPCFALLSTLQVVLDQAVALTGSFRGDICLSPDGLGSHLSGRISYLLHTKDKTNENIRSCPPVKANSICGIAYYQSTVEHGVYLKDVGLKVIAEESRLGHYGDIDYVTGHDDVRSELALPIEADGVRVGVLNLESKLIAAYSADHKQVARRFAEKVGRLYATTFERQRRGNRLDPSNTEPAYEAMQELFKRLWSIARKGKQHSGNLAFLIYKADYEHGSLKAQNPGKTIFRKRSDVPPGKRGNSDGFPTPEFTFQGGLSTEQSLVAQVFSDGRPRAYPDVGEAIREGKITDRYSAVLKLAGPIIGFPVLIHGHIAGVVVCWHLDGAPNDFDGRDIELFRRACHLVANIGADQRDKGSLFGGQQQPPRNEKAADEPRPIDVSGALRIVSTLDEMPSQAAPVDRGYLNPLGLNYQSAIGPAIREFLKILNEHETRFQPDEPRPTLWVSPRRCRVWIRACDASNGKPRFALALQISLAPDDPDKNTFQRKPQERKRFGLAMEPLQRPFPGARHDGSASHGEFADQNNGPTPPPRVGSVKVKGSGEFLSLIYDNNPHFSFLLSRISAYRFAFQQRPGPLGPDVMAEVLDKDRKLPWFVAPLIVNTPDEWRVDSPVPVKSIQTRLAGYLTFDNGPAKQNNRGAAVEAKPNIPITERWASVQNELLHEMELFTSCLAQARCFEDLIEEK